MAGKLIKAIGLMSGTSLDGIDAAIVTTDGEEIQEFGEFITVPYEDGLRERLRTAITDKEVNDDSLERDMTLAHVEAVKQLGVEADLIGFHGQTIIHRPDLGWSQQIGDGELMAKELGITTYYDFRNEDMRHGGQGAPLVPVFHRAITSHLLRPLAIVNIGGVANVTWIRANGEMLAFDTGPGNAMINDIMKREFGQDFDDGGEVAARGTIDEEVLAQYVEDEYFKAPPPKSLDRNHFSLDPVKHLKPEDAVATLTAFTAMSIMMSNSYFDNPVEKFYITGGGRLNKRIMQTLGDKAAPIEDIKLGGKPLNGDAFEAQAFAYLAARAHLDLPITFPSTTGCKTSPTENIAKLAEA